MAKTHRQTSSHKAGLIFPVGRIERHLRDTAGTKRISRKASVTLAAILEDLVHEILECTKIMMDNHNKKYKHYKNERIKPTDIHRAICMDSELYKAFGDIVIPDSSFVPRINQEIPSSPARVPKKTMKRKAASKKNLQKDGEYSSDENHASTSHASTSHPSTSHASKSHAHTSHASKKRPSTSHASTKHAHASHASTSHGNTSHSEEIPTTPQPPKKSHASSHRSNKSHDSSHHHTSHTSQIDTSPESPSPAPTRPKKSNAGQKTTRTSKGHQKQGHNTSHTSHQSSANKRKESHPEQHATPKRRRPISSQSLFDTDEETS